MPTDPHPHAHSLRLTFAQQGGQVRLTGVQRVEMIAPGTATDPPGTGQAGHWVELRDGDGSLLYHRAFHDPAHSSIEIFGDTPHAELRRVQHPAERSEFDIVVPDDPRAATVTLHGPAAGAPGHHAPAETLVSEDFGSLRSAAEPRSDTA
jgi:hypothetical protein